MLNIFSLWGEIKFGNREIYSGKSVLHGWRNDLAMCHRYDKIVCIKN